MKKIINISNLISGLLLFESNFDDFEMILTYPKWMVNKHFTRSLKNYSRYAPIDPKTKNPTLILFMTSSGPHIWYSLNAYCSIRTFLPTNYFIFIALDSDAYYELKSYGVPTILYKYKAQRIRTTVLKVILTYQALLLGIDAFFSDVDLVFFDSPFKVLNNVSELEIIHEIADFPPKTLQTNTGLYKVNSNKNSIAFVKKWIELCFMWNDEQIALNNYIVSSNGSWIGDNVYKIYSSDLNFSVSIHHFDSFLVTMSNSLFSNQMRKIYSNEALRRKIYKPVVFHLAWYWPTRKPSVLYEKNAWFNDFPNSKKCKDVPPNGTQLIWDNKYDLPESPNIPKKYPIKNFPK